MRCSSKFFRPGRRLGGDYSTSVPHRHGSIPSSTSPPCFPPSCSPSPVSSSLSSGQSRSSSQRLCSVRLPHRQPPVGQPPLSDSATAALWGSSVRGAAGLHRYLLMGRSAVRRRPTSLPDFGEGARGAAPASAVAAFMRKASASGSHCEGPPWWGRGR
jgi:hypothetical protein